MNTKVDRNKNALKPAGMGTLAYNECNWYQGKPSGGDYDAAILRVFRTRMASDALLRDDGGRAWKYFYSTEQNYLKSLNL
jgi:hypothetical protein